ncbi:Structural maintenance of chromosomes protein 4 [Phytophthora cactorum]|nr:Structural maintenance of chromosomes protein 4 [Phytophthora cactorum]KAG2810061.1 Structural maintenance of chromosomes protein 4 [Phytophthora cactorum]KAG2810658.1 Structural maintenance of chromosomes protein 4 [Phytophthora cactorum]KAG2865522.1 Structural maintenance of chromosomes protein 4 [Phytophthora cactorum]KAG2901564.1 Structural maintenance of chromosomes protein 4 [Phytophthora cactorum]
MVAQDVDAAAPPPAEEQQEQEQEVEQETQTMETEEDAASEAQPPSTPGAKSPAPAVSTPAKAAPVKRLMITNMQLENFKSYAGKVEIGPFHKCFSAVVGPNGSGKSNVIDALLFVFGKRASKLRLKKVSELVHRSANFPDLDMATVSVFFQEIIDTDEQDTANAATDNEANYSVVPNSQFSVTRTATKGNVSKYYVNDRPSNFTRVTELLQDKGIDLDNNRFLILQGEVEQIAMMKSKGAEGTNEDGLLEYLEDIIGSNVYVEPTERVWDEVEQCNEVRGDKVNRVKLVEKEKAHLEGPRAEALEYLRKEKEVYMKTNILYQLWIQEASKNRELCESKRDELQAKYKAELARMEKNREELQSVEAVYQRVKSEHDEVAKQLDEAKTEYAEFEKQDVKLREELKYAKERQKELQSAQKKELKKQKNIEQKMQENEELVPQLEQEVEKLQTKLKKQEQVLESIIEGHKEETAKLRSTMEEIQQEMEPFQTEMNALRSVIDTTETEIQLVEEPVTNAKKALEANACGVIEAEANLRGLEEEQNEKREKLTKMKDRIDVAEQELDDVKGREGSVAEKYREARTKAEEASGAVQSHATRNRMLRELLEASKPGKPLEKAGLFGRLGDLGAIDGKYDVAISTACGALNNLVVETTSGAQACVAYLRKHNLGRTTFLILEQLGYLKSKYSQRFHGVTAPSGQQAPRLFDLVKVNDEKYLPAFYYALRDTLVAKDLDEASAIAYQGRQCKYRVVTLDGQLVEMSGAMSGGGKRARSGGMSSTLASGLNEDEIRDLQEEASSLRSELGQIRDEKESLEKELTHLSRKIEQYENDLPKIELNVSATKTRLEDFKKNKSVLEKQTSLSPEAKKQVEKLNKTKTAKEAEYKTTKMKVDKMAAKLAKMKEQILDVGGEKLRKEQDVAKKITKQIAEKTKQMTKIRVDFKSSQKNTEKNEHALKKIEEDTEAAKKKIEDTREQITAMEEKALAVLQKSEAVQEEVTAKEKELRKDEAKYRKLKKEYDEMASAEVDLANSLEDCEKMLEENSKKESYWKTKLTALHDAFITEQEQNAGVFEDERDLPARKRQKKTRDTDGDEAMDEEQKEEDDEESEDSEEEEDANLDVTLEKLPMLDPAALSRYSKEEMKYEISVLEQQRDELKANVNMGALTEYKQKQEEYKARVVELEEATKLRDAKRHEYDELRRKRLEEFMTGFRTITLKLKEMYQMITLGGDAELELVDSLDPFSEGVVFSVRPSKKSWKNISNLSGGEKTLASLALVFALHHYKPTPLYVMDEIDAALDFKNVSIVGNYIKQRTRNAQFIIISLRNNMFELADRLVGIYKTNDATKSVTINPKIYEQGTGKAANGTSTPMTKKPGTPSMNSPKSGSRPSVKKARRSSQQSVTSPVALSAMSTPLQDRTNRS